jgi:hypothetical protein
MLVTLEEVFFQLESQGFFFKSTDKKCCHFLSEGKPLPSVTHNSTQECSAHGVLLLY